MTPTTTTTKIPQWVIGWSLTILTLSCIPYVVALLAAPPGWQFAGFLVNPLDGHSYIAKMAQGQAGDWLFHLTYTPEPHSGAFIFIFYLLLGHVARITYLPLILIFHIARILAGFFLLQTAYHFIAKITPQENEQRLAFLLLITSSGFGWLGAMFGAFPIDLWIPEAFVPYSLYANPHFPLGMALMLVILQHIIWPKSGFKSYLGVSLSGLALALVLPFALLTVWVISGVYLCFRYFQQQRLPWTEIWPTLSLVIFSAPVIGYDYWVSITNEILMGWSTQNITTAPTLSNLILGYGLVGVLAMGGIWLMFRQQPGGEARGLWLVTLWVLSTLILIYLPFTLQRRLLNGLHIPLVILAAVGLERIGQRILKARQYQWVKIQVIVLGGLGTLFVWALPLFAAFQAPDQAPTTALLFLRESEITAFGWLKQRVHPEDVILTGPRLGMFVPGQTEARAYYGHPFETIKAEQKKANVEAFFRGEVETVSPPATFIIYGPDERAWGLPVNLENYEVVFEAGPIVIYKVEP